MSSNTSNIDIPPPPYSSVERTRAPIPTADAETVPLSASVRPADSNDGRRRLLLVYVHGFMGTEESFQHFPAHVHNMVSALLDQSHIVQTKVYPRYRSKKSIQEAAQAFAAWLEPHASPETDVILLGHSMGGLLLAETVLLGMSTSSTTMATPKPVLGTINFDTPFLGMHPGIITAGLGSLFRGGDELPAVSSDPRAGQLMDPNFNPAFFNDTRLPVRSAWKNAAHFVNKHSQNLTSATKQVITSHIDFGKCLADYNGLKVRYCRIRMLEDEDVSRRRTVAQGVESPPRVRFVNYYTASTGRPPRPKSPVRQDSSTVASRSLSTSSEQVQSAEAIEAHSNRPFVPPEKGPIVIEDSDEETVMSDLSDLDPLEDTDARMETMTLSDNTSLRSIRKRPPVDAIPRKPVPFDVEAGVAGPSSPSKGPLPPSFEESRLASMPALDFDPFQPGLPLEPDPLPPPPSAMQYDDLEKYREELHMHGVSSKAYFKERKAHQKALYEKFMAESKAKTDGFHAQIRDLHGMLAEEAKRVAEASAENVRIMVEVQNDEVLSLQEHRKLVAEFRKQRGASATPKVAAMLDKADQKLSEKQAKLAKKIEHDREKMLRKQAKEQRKILGKPGARSAGSSRTDDTTSRGGVSSIDAASVADDDSFFDATREFVGQVDRGPVTQSERPTDTQPPTTGYDMQTAPIARVVHTLPEANAPREAGDGVPSGLRPAMSPSQVSLSTDSASGSFSYATPSPTALTSQTSIASSLAGAEPDSLTGASKPKKDRKFCTLPPADASGVHDHTWVRIYMENVDEVGAHCGLFFCNAPSDGKVDAQGWSARYASLVTEVGERIEGWVGEEMTRRALEHMDDHS